MTSPFAEDINYWQSSKSDADTWMERTKNLIVGMDGRFLSEGFGRDADGNAAFMLQFQIGDDLFRAVWPVLPSRTGKERAAKVQAATMLHHDIKAKCLSAKVLGARAAFFAFLQLPDGRSASEASTPELVAGLPALIKPRQLLGSD